MSQDQPHPLVSRLGLSPDQSQAALARDRDIVVTAGAGTGKTRTLVARFLSLLAGGTPLRSIIAITFTRKAAQEMRNRVRQELDAFLQLRELPEADRAWWDEQRALLDAARIGTIHTLCGEILRSHPADAGLDPRFQVLEEAPARLLQNEAVTAALAWAAEEEAAVALFRLLPEYTLRSALAQLLVKRLEASQALASLPEKAEPAAILERWQSLLEGEQSAALATLLESAAWREHQAALFQHAATDRADRQEIQRRAVVDALRDAPVQPNLAQKLDLLATVGRINLSGGRSGAWPGGKEQLDEVKAALRGLRQLWQEETILALRINEADQQLAQLLPLLGALFRRATAYYQGQKGALHALDFDDLEDGAIRLLQGHAAVRDYWQATARAVLVDEFQDTNERQRQLVRLLCPEAGKLFIVGDAKQSIYRFRGADVAVFRHEEAQIATKGGLSLELETSYRAHRQLLAGLNDLMRPILGDPGAGQPPWQTPFSRLVHQKEEPAEGLAAPFLEVHLAAGSKAEGGLHRAARALATRLAELKARSALDYGDMAILCRASTGFAAYEDALDEAGIPFVTVAGKGFYDRPEIRELLNALRALADPNDDLALAGLLRSPVMGLSDAALFSLSKARKEDQTLWQAATASPVWAGEEQPHASRAASLIQQLQQLAGRASVADLLKAFLDETDYRAALRSAGLGRGVRNVTKLLQDAHGSGLISVGDFLEYVASLKDAGSREGEARTADGGAVQIMSVHQAKGLEFPLVIIGDATYRSNRGSDMLIDPLWGVVLKLSNEEGQAGGVWQLARLRDRAQEEAEDRRLFYVAATRAEQMLMFNASISLSGKTALPTRLAGWLKLLAEITGLDQWDCSAYEEDGDKVLSTGFMLGATPITASLYESQFAGVARTTARPEERRFRPAPLPPPFLAPLIKEAEDGTDPGSASAGRTAANLVWQVVPALDRPFAPAWVIGSLVHEGLAQWRLAQAGLDDWLEARAQALGLLDERRLADAVRGSRGILERFRRHPLFREIDGASRRWHELPYSRSSDGVVDRGIIDLLYERDGSWTLVDFKSDRLRDEAQLARLMQEQGYEAQVARYGDAIEALLDHRPRLLLCFLNLAGRVHLHDVVGYSRQDDAS